jgi:cytochrome P450
MYNLLTHPQERIDQIEAIRRQDSSPLPSSTLLTTYTPDVGTKTILHTLLTSALPPDEKTTPRLAEEAVLLVGAATHTTSWVLTVLTYHLLAQPALLAHLKAELATVSRNPETELYRLEDLEKLPFLTAVIKEGLRLGYGIAGRSARIAQDVSLRCGEWITPPGTPVSMTIPLTHHNEALFPDSHRFDPERWLTPTSRNLEKYLVAFSKGSRSCVGINLAWAELYLCTAGVVGSFGTEGDEGVMELWETDERDVRLDRDLFFPVARVGSKGVRVRISSP